RLSLGVHSSGRTPDCGGNRIACDGPERVSSFTLDSGLHYLFPFLSGLRRISPGDERGDGNPSACRYLRSACRRRDRRRRRHLSLRTGFGYTANHLSPLSEESRRRTDPITINDLSPGRYPVSTKRIRSPP